MEFLITENCDVDYDDDDDEELGRGHLWHSLRSSFNRHLSRCYKKPQGSNTTLVVMVMIIVMNFIEDGARFLIMMVMMMVISLL